MTPRFREARIEANSRLFGLALAVELLAAGCSGAPVRQALGPEFVRRCSDSDILKDTIFMGQSNVIGPGSVWSQEQNGSYTPLSRLSDVVKNPADREGLVQKGSDTDCSSNSNWQLSMEAGVPLVLGTAKVDGGVTAALKSADSVTVHAKAVAVDVLLVAPFQEKLSKLLDSGEVRPDAFSAGRLIVTKAVRVSGLVADFHYGGGVNAGIKAAIPANQVVATGPEGMGISASYTNETTLSVNSPGEFYIAVGFSQVQAAGVGADGHRVVSLVRSDTSAVVAEPDWVKFGVSSRFPEDGYLTGFAKVAGDSVDDAKAAATTDLNNRILDRLRHQSFSSVDPTGNQADALASLTRASANVRISGVSYETYLKDGHAYAFVYRQRSAVADERRSQIGRFLAKAKELISSGERAEESHNEGDAAHFYYSAQLAVASAAEDDAVANAILAGGTPGDLAMLSSSSEEHIRRVLKKTASDLSEAVSLLAFQLAQQGLSHSAHVKVAPLTFGVTQATSEFGNDLAQRLEGALARTSSDGHLTGDLILNGNYFQEGDTWRLRVLARDSTTREQVANAECHVPRRSVPAELATQPANFEQAVKDQRLLTPVESSVGGLHLDIWTNKGRSNLVFADKEPLKIFFKVNQPCYVRLIYILASGHKMPIDQGYFVDAAKVNQEIEYPAKFEIGPPLGIENIYGVAFPEQPEPLPTEHLTLSGEDYEVISGGTDRLVKHRGLRMHRQSTPESAPQESGTAEAIVSLTTLPAH